MMRGVLEDILRPRAERMGFGYEGISEDFRSSKLKRGGDVVWVRNELLLD